jgi:hypothetical protein
MRRRLRRGIDLFAARSLATACFATQFFGNHTLQARLRSPATRRKSGPRPAKLRQAAEQGILSLLSATCWLCSLPKKQSEGAAFHGYARKKADSSGKIRPRYDNLSVFPQPV